MIKERVKRKEKKQAGQIALVVLAVMAVTLTIGLSLSRRVLTDIQVSEQEEESAKAFSAAEAGIEEALRRLKAGEDLAGIGDYLETQLGEGLEIDVSTASLTGGERFRYPRTLNPGEAVIIWLVGHNSDGTLNEGESYDGGQITLCWDNDDAALEAILFYRSDVGDDLISHYGYDPDPERRDNNGLAEVSGSCPEFDHGQTIDLPEGTPLFLVLKPLYQTSQVGVASPSGSSLPSQGYEIIATGQADIGSSRTVSRKIKVFRGWNTLPAAFFSAISAGGSISGGM